MTLPSSVFLTGGTGLLGSHVAEQLRERDVRVLALQRPSSDTRFLESLGCEIVEGDVREGPEALAPKAAGCEAAVHSAALVYAGESWPAVREVNVEGTRNVVAGAALAGARRAVHVSSVAVYGRTVGVAHESVPLDAPLRSADLYARSKREAERVAEEAAREHHIDLTTVRPSVIYGERDRLFIPRLARLATLPRIPLLGDGRNRVPVVYAGNVARGIVTILVGRGAGGTYNLSEDEPLTQRGLLGGFARGLGRDPRFLSIPARAIRTAADLTSWVGGALPGLKGLSLSRVAQLGLEDNPYPAGLAHEALDWTDHTPHLRALEGTAHWWTTQEDE